MYYWIVWAVYDMWGSMHGSICPFRTCRRLLMWTFPDDVLLVCACWFGCVCVFHRAARCQFVQIDTPGLARVQFPQFSGGAAVAVFSGCRCLVRVVRTLATL